MDLSRPFPNRAPTPARYAGIGMVVALHLAGIYALSAGLINPPAKQREITELKRLPPEPPQTPPVVEPLRPTQPTLHTPQPIPVPMPDIDIAPTTEAPLISTTTLRGDPTPVVTAGLAKTDVAPPPTVQPQIRAPGAVCSVMPRPEVPAIAWSGEAVLQVMATVRGGRVVGSEFRVTQGALDSKSRRALQRSVESALAGYQCQGDAMFQQDFAFRVD